MSTITGQRLLGFASIGTRPCPLLMGGVLAALIVTGGQADAQTIRTYVSTRGSDANPCTRGAPCLTFQGALAKTTAGGEILALNSGDFGPVTITQSVISLGLTFSQIGSALGSMRNGAGGVPLKKIVPTTVASLPVGL